MFEIEPVEESFTLNCDCCGRPSRTVWGYVHSASATTLYYVHWAPGFFAESGANWDLVVGSWGDDVGPEQRAGISLDMQLVDDGPAFMVVDAGARPFSKSGIFSLSMSRLDIIGTPLAPQIFEIVDAVFAHDARLAELRA